MARHLQSAVAKTSRNSSLELLRIISALLICGRHFVGANLEFVASQPLSVNKVFLQAVIYAGGKVGVVCFFLISAWYLCDPDVEIKGCLRRAWLLERDLIFWSVALFGSFVAFDRGALTPKLAVGMLLPVIMDVWWYPASYVIFLLLLPFIVRGPRALGKHLHGLLALALLQLLMSGVVAGILPGVTLDMEKESVFVFLYLFALATYVKWYGSPPRRSTAVKMVALGLAISIGVNMALNIAAMRLPSLAGKVTYIVQDEWMLPVSLMGFGLFFLFLGFEWHSPLVNRFAKWAFPCYLINAYPAMKMSLWSGVFRLQPMYDSPLLIVSITWPLLATYLVSGVAEEAKALLFRLDPRQERGMHSRKRTSEQRDQPDRYLVQASEQRDVGVKELYP